MLDLVSWMLLGGGALLAVIGAVGVLRMPDFYTRAHAGSVTETAGMTLILTGLLLQAPDFACGIRLVITAAFMLITSPTAAHALAYSAMRDGIDPVQGERKAGLS